MSRQGGTPPLLRGAPRPVRPTRLPLRAGVLAPVGTVPVGAGTLQVTVSGLTAGIGRSFTVTDTTALGTSPASVRTMPVVPTA